MGGRERWRSECKKREAKKQKQKKVIRRKGKKRIRDRIGMDWKRKDRGEDRIGEGIG